MTMPATAQRPHGRLRIYFGAAGVGKTHALVAAARARAAAGCDVVVGVVGGRDDGQAAGLLGGLERLPLAGGELDLDAALARRPGLLLIDPLAHTNRAGMRHPQRWQDVEELLSAGIDVSTTLDVQNLESLNDVMGTLQERVTETVPDTVFDQAADIVLIDLPPHEVLAGEAAQRRVVTSRSAPPRAEAERKGALLALRELALRRTADRVESDVQAYRAQRPTGSVWKTAAALLACVGPDAGAERVVRAAARLATQLNADWHAIYVETPSLQRLPVARRERILATLSLAQRLGASTAVIAAADVAQSAVAYARRHNLSKLVIGRDAGRRLWPWQRPSGQRLAQLAPDIDLIEIGRPDPHGAGGAHPGGQYDGAGGRHPGRGGPRADAAPRSNERRLGKRLRYLWAALACAAVTALCMPLAAHFDRSNIVAVFILTVVLVAVRLGRGPAALAAVLGVGAFDYFFVPPRFSFAVSDVQYLLTFFIMLAVGLITGQLTAGLRFQARVAAHREDRAGALYDLARELSGAVQIEDMVRISARSIEKTFRATAAVLLPDAQGALGAVSPGALSVDLAIAQWAFEGGQPAGSGTDTLPGSEVLYLPLRAPSRARGVLAVKATTRRVLRIPEQRQLLDTFAALIAFALERVHYVGLAQEALVKVESERLRNSLLAALSHDLRTPLTVLVGLADALAFARPGLAAAQLETAQAIKAEALRMSTLVSNLLDMARIESGEVKLNLEWQPLEEVVGTALSATRSLLAQHRLELRIPRDLPLVRLDAVLIERVLVNLLENAAKYSPVGSTVTLSAQVVEDRLSVAVADDGPGLPAGLEEAIFQKFTRGDPESATPGVGLGLAICRAIVESHQGRILGQNNVGGGASLIFTLPLGEPPAGLLDTEVSLE